MMETIYLPAQYFTFCEKLIEFQNFFEFSEGKIYDKNTGTAISNEIVDLVINSEKNFDLSNIYQIMAASHQHLSIGNSFTSHLSPVIKPKGLRIYQECCHIYIKLKDKFRIPDVVVADFAKRQINAQNQLENPLWIGEILSPSTENIDLIAKVEEYQSIESLQEYIIIWQDQPKVLQYSRLNNHWIKTEYEDLNDILTFDSLEISLPLRVLYEDVDFEKI